MKKEESGFISLGRLLAEKGFTAMPVRRIFLHEKFHTDEACCFWMSRSDLFKAKVHQVFPEIETAERQFWSLGQTISPRELTDTLSFGCRGGRIDEHALESEEYQNTAAAELFVRLCGIHDASLEAIITKVIIEDRNGAMSPESIHNVMKQIHRMDDGSRPSNDELLEWTCLAFEAEYLTFACDQEMRIQNPPLTVSSAKRMIAKHFGPEKAEEWSDLPKRAAKNAKSRSDRMLVKLRDDRASPRPQWWSTVTCIVHGKRQQVPMFVMETDSHEALKCAIDLGATIVVVQKASGNVVVFTDRRKSIDLSVVTLALREEELEAMWERNEIQKRKPFSPKTLICRGQVKGWPELAPYWFLHDVPRDAANQLYNGTESASGVFPTAIPLETIVTIVKVVLAGQFHPMFYKGCLRGSCAGHRCPWFSWDLGRCEPVKENTFAARR